jgi:hypothetical protein
MAKKEIKKEKKLETPQTPKRIQTAEGKRRQMLREQKLVKVK